MDWISKLRFRMDSLAVFEELKQDEAVSRLMRYLSKPSAAAYSAFVSSLYRANGGNLSAYIKEISEICPTPYVKRKARGEGIDRCLKDALDSELETLQTVADLTPQDLTALLTCRDGLPGFVSGGVDIAGNYREHVDGINRFGYGMYAKHRAFFVDDAGCISPIRRPDTTRLSQLFGYREQRGKVLDNTVAFLRGLPASHVCLTGDAGTGKSATVKALVNEYYEQGLRIVEVRKDQLSRLPGVIDELADQPLKFIIFLDDLSFRENDDAFNGFKAILEGSVASNPSNILIYATSNRRHIVRETFSDRDGDEIHRNDAMQETASLSERFGLRVTFGKPDKSTYLAIVAHLAEQSGIAVDDDLRTAAERFALNKTGRSARAAKQFVDSLISGNGDGE